MTSSKNWIRRSLQAPLILLASLLIWLQETLWAILKWLTSKIALVPLVRWIEGQIQRLPPYATVVVFFLPLTILLPFKLVAVYWLSRGYWLRSLLVIIAAKVLGTAIEARMFVICKPQLMTIGWFRRLHDFVLLIRDRVHAALNELAIYQIIRAKLRALKQQARQLAIRLKNWWQSFRRSTRRNQFPE